MAITGGGDSVLVGSTIGLMAGLLLVIAGRAIVDAVQSDTYQTVLGIEVINSLVLTMGAVVCIISLLGIIVGVVRLVWQR